MKTYKLLLTVVAALACCGAAVAQNGETSPYSMFGYGSLSDFSTSTQRAMGGVGYAMNNGRQINVKNPASYAHCDSLTFLFDFGLDFTGMKMTENGKSGKSFGGGLDYITMQFPLSKTVGGSIGLVPYSSVGYSFGGSSDGSSDGQNARGGSGGINMLYVGVSYMPFKNFSIGANVSYNFGSITHDTYVSSTIDGVSSQSLYERVLEVKDWGIQFGAQYTIDLNEQNSITLGAVYIPKKSFRGTALGRKYDSQNDATAAIDTVSNISMKDRFTSPATYGGGIAYNLGNKLTVSADFTYQNWASAKYENLANFERVAFDNRWKIAVGVSYTPNVRGNYLQRMTYRMGGHFNHDYIMVGKNNVKDYGVSVGFGLPAPSSKTVINIGFEYKHRAAYPANLISENYFNITVGVNFNEMWFWQNKIR